MSAKSTAQIDAKREEFRKYLEKEGILESLTKTLVALYEEPDKPSDALSYVRSNFASGEMQVMKSEVDILTKENEKLKQKVTSLESDKAALEKRIREMEKAAQNVETAVPATNEPTKEVEKSQDPVEGQSAPSPEKSSETEAPVVDDSTEPAGKGDPAKESAPSTADTQILEKAPAEESTPATEVVPEVPAATETEAMETDAPQQQSDAA